MHDTAYRIGGLVMDTYLPSTPAKILEIGAQNVNGSLRDHAPRNAEYIGLDFEQGNGVDIVVTGLSDWNVPDASFDMVMASSVFEHDKAFWRTFLAMCAKTRPGGHIYVSAPSNGTVHRYPQDYWRFYPDAGLALQEWACAEGFEVSLVESFIAEREAEVWNDFCAVFRRGPCEEGLGQDFVFRKVPSTNAVTWRSSVVINPVEDSEDTRLLRTAREDTQRWIHHADHLNDLHVQEMEQRNRQIADLTRQIEQQAQHLTGMSGTAEELTVFRQRVKELEGDLEQLAAETQEQARQREEEIREMAATSGTLQSRLAQREEEAAQAWAVAEERGQERDRLVEEAKKARADLIDANGWVERLALTRTQMERRASKLEKALVKTSKDLERLQQRNKELVERTGEPLSQTAFSAPSLSSWQVARKLIKNGQENGLEQSYEVAMADLERSRACLNVVTEDLSEARSRLEECHDEIASLSDMMAEAQDRIAELEWQNEWLREAGAFLLERGKWWWRLMPSAWRRRKRDTQLLRRGMFDAHSYSNRYPDVSCSGQDPFRHFIHHGIAENRRHD